MHTMSTISRGDPSAKTVFVMDHTQYFGISSECPIDLDFNKLKSNQKPLVNISKSLWTSAVESSVEYCRIVWDLFPNGKMIRFVVSDSNAHIVNTWNPAHQSISHVMNAFALVGIPPPISATAQTSDYSVIHGLRAAAEALADPTDEQLQLLHQPARSESTAAGGSSMHSPPPAPPMPANAGRVICITSARDNSSMKSLEDIFMTLVVQSNQTTAQSGGRNADGTGRLNIDRCHFVIINMYPANQDTMVTDRAAENLSTTLQTEIHSVRASDISAKLTHLILPHYDLASTTVTGIPMKEEQNASSSANYDVEIFHARNAHSVITGSELALPSGIKEGYLYETVTLKWCTPRGLGASDMQPCVAQHRVTPVDVTSRPSSCLINFLLNGRSVLLEMPRKAGGKLTSHLLSAHGGEIFIHTLHVSRSCLEDPPSILEGGGGRVMDYRIPDFAAVMQQHRLLPLRPAAGAALLQQATEDGGGGGVGGLHRVRRRLQRRTQYWPLTLSNTILYNVRQFVEPLLMVVDKQQMHPDEVLLCQQALYTVVALEQRHEPLSLPLGAAHRLKGSRKEEQYRLLWAELEALLATGPQTTHHRLVLQCVRECYRSRHPNAKMTPGAGGGGDGGKPLGEAMIDGVDGALALGRRNLLVHKATTDSPRSPPRAKELAVATVGVPVKVRTLLDMFTASERERTTKRLDFSGRLCTPPGQVAKLYPNVGPKDATANARSDAVDTK